MNELCPCTHSPYDWPLIFVTGFQLVLAWYCWRRRRAAGATALALLFFCAGLWGFGALLEFSAADAPTRILWVKFQALWPLPMATCALCFILQYTGQGRALTRRVLITLALPPLTLLLLALTNDLHHLMWPGFALDSLGNVLEYRGLAHGFSLVYAFVLAMVSLIVLVRHFIHAPAQRWPTALVIGCVVAVRVTFLADALYANLVWTEDFTKFVLALVSVVYASVLFRFHAVDPIPVARAIVTEQMREGMLVVDTRGIVRDLNPMAQIILGRPAAAIQGRPVSEFVPAVAQLGTPDRDDTSFPVEIRHESQAAPRYYALRRSPLCDRRKRSVGCLLLLTDVTTEKRVQDALMLEQRATAALQERQHLARELHDSLGQVLGYVSMQAQATRKYALDGDLATTATQLNRLALVAQAAHDDLRFSILSLLTDSGNGWSFFTALRQLLDAYRDRYGMQLRLILPDGLDDSALEADTAIQLTRVIQEALTNASAHGQAGCVQLTFERTLAEMRVVISDDGVGFDPAQPPAPGGHHFGLDSMRERMEQVGGAFAIHSRPGSGTRVELTLPLRLTPEKTL